MNREELYQRINDRVDKMIDMGLLDEVRSFYDKNIRSKPLLSGIGYKEIYAYLEGEMSLEEAVYVIKRDTRHFAKRQLTWFRREREVCWIEKEAYANDENRMLEAMLQILQGKNIIDEKRK